MAPLSSISRTPSQTTFDRLRDVYGVAEAPDVAPDVTPDRVRGDPRANAVLKDYFNALPHDERVGKARDFIDRAKTLPNPARHAITHGVSAGLEQVSQACAQAHKLIEKLCVEREVQRVQDELAKGFAYHGMTLQDAANQARAAVQALQDRLQAQVGGSAAYKPVPPIDTDLVAMLRESAALDEAVIAVVERVPLDRINQYLNAYTEEVAQLSNRMHALEQSLQRLHVAVGPGAKVRPLSPEERAAYAHLRGWAKQVQPGFHAALEKLDQVPDEARVAASKAQVDAFVTLNKRSALTLVRRAFDRREMDTLARFRGSPLWEEMEPMARHLDTQSKMAVMHAVAPLVSFLCAVGQERGCALAADGHEPIDYRDSSAKPGLNIEADPFADICPSDEPRMS